jgi:hypothetical protein
MLCAMDMTFSPTTEPLAIETVFDAEEAAFLLRTLAEKREALPVESPARILARRLYARINSMILISDARRRDCEVCDG